MQGIQEICGSAGETPSVLDQVFHGTTIATNIVIEHNGAKVGMMTTEGYRDILHIARHKKPLQLLDLPGSAVAALPDRAAPLPADGARADHEGRLRARGARRGEGARAGSQAEGGRRRGGLGLLPVLVPQPGARAAGGRDRARGVPGGVPVGLLGGAAAVPRVRAFLDRLPERLRRARRSPPTSGGCRSSCRASA